jgi:hypothetical protein
VSGRLFAIIMFVSALGPPANVKTSLLRLIIASGILYTWYKAVHDGMYWYVPVRTLLGTWRYEKPQNGTYQYVPT